MPSSTKRLLIAVALFAGVGCIAAYVATRPTSSRRNANANRFQPSQPTGSAESTENPRGEATVVKVIHPARGEMEHTSVQPGSVQAFESVQLFAKVSGYLKSQEVDIGDRVKRGQVVAIVDVPELVKQVQRNRAALDQAKARIEQMKAQVASARADLEAAKAAVAQSEASTESAGANMRFRSKQLSRMKELFSLKSIDERLVDESQERYEAAFQAELAAKASITTTRALVAASEAKIQMAEADVEAAKAEVKVVQADLEKSDVQLGFAKITAPFDGVITHRSFTPGDFVRSATEGGGQLSLLTVQRTDRMRVIVQVPDREVPFIDPGDLAEVEIDALPGEKLSAKVSRIAGSEDPQTRLMRVEIDLPNTNGKIRQGMYGRVTIQLDNAAEHLSIPVEALAGKSEKGSGMAFILQDGRAKRVSFHIGVDNGVRVMVQDGLTEDDLVILNPGALKDGAPVRLPEPPDRERVAARESSSP